MNPHNRRIIALFGSFLTLLVLGFSDTAQAQTVTLTPSVLNFNVASGQTSPAQTVHVTTSNDPTTVIVQVSGSSPWVHVDQTVVNTPADLHVTVSGLTQGTYVGSFTVAINGNAASVQTVTVNANVGGSSLLSATPSSLTFNGQVGATQGSPQGCPTSGNSCLLSISSSGIQLGYNVSVTPLNSTWLQLNTLSGTTGGQPLVVGVNPSLVAGAGTYTATITAQSTTTNDSVSVNVTMTVGGAATLSVTPSGTLQFFYQTGTAIPSAKSLTLTSSDGFLPFQVSQNLPTWLTVSPISGSASSSSPATLTVSVNPTSPVVLQPGNYSAQITITPSGGSPLTVAVSLVVSNNPFLTVSQSTINFSAPFGGAAPSPTQIAVGSTGGSLNFTAAASSAQGWLTVSPTSGSTGASALAVTIGINSSVLTTLPVGTYNGTVTFAPTNGDTYTIPIAVTLTVGTSSTVTAAPSALVFSYQTSQATPGNQIVSLAATGPAVNISVATSVTAAANCTGANWLSAVPQGNQTPTLLTVSVNTAGMTPGTCTGTVNVAYSTTSGNVTLQIPVTLYVSSTPILSINLPQGFGQENATLNGNSIARAIQVTSTDGVTALQYQVVNIQSAGCSWLFASPTLNFTPSNVTVQIIPGCITVPGTYQGSLTITSASLPAPVTENITLVVNPNVTVSASPTRLAFTQPQGAAAPAAQTLTFSTSGGNASFIATATTDFGGNWLSVTPTSGSTSVGTLSVNAGSTTLPIGTYTGNITINFQGAVTSSLTIPVTLSITSPQTVTVSPTSLSFAYQQGSALPASQKITVSSTGGSANFTVAVSSSGWLSVDSNSGTTPKDINVSVNPQNVPVGTPVTGTITISSAALSTPLTVTVTLTVTALPPPQPTTVFNSASNIAGAIAPGELITIKGLNLGPVSPAAGTSFTICCKSVINPYGGVGSTLAGVQVLFNGNAGTPTFVSATQINVIVPYEIDGQTTVNIVVVNQGVQSTAIQQSVTSASPALYTFTANGLGQAAAVNLTGSTAGTFNGPPAGVTTALGVIPTSPVQAGQYIAVFGTGGGQTNPRSTTGSINSATTLMPLLNWAPGSGTVTATIGGQPAVVQFAGAAPTLVTGVIQFNLQVPAGVTGNNLPVVITVNGQAIPSGVTVAVQ